MCSGQHHTLFFYSQLTRYFHKQCNLIVLFRFVTHVCWLRHTDNCLVPFFVVGCVMAINSLSQFGFFFLQFCALFHQTHMHTQTVSQLAFIRAINIWETRLLLLVLLLKFSFFFVLCCCCCWCDFECARLPASLLEHRKQNVWMCACVCALVCTYIRTHI